MKYIIVSHNDMEVPIIFPDSVSHKAFQHFHPISAGFCEVYTSNGKISYAVRGKSIGLQIEARQEDANIIKYAFEFEGME